MAKAEIIFMGTGTSSGVPNVSCLTDPVHICRTCHSDDPRDKRLNTSVVLRRKDDGTTVLLDCGKFFYEAAKSIFPKHGLRRIDGAVISHDHADAANGLDDLRDWTLRQTRQSWTEDMGLIVTKDDFPVNQVQEQVVVYGSERVMEHIRRVYPYLYNTQYATGGGAVSQLDFKTIDEKSPFNVSTYKLIPLKVNHGPNDYNSMGFRCGNASIIFDCKFCPEETAKLIEGTEVLIYDLLHMLESHPSHATLHESLAFVQKIKPKVAYFVGVTHMVKHTEVEEDWPVEAHLGYDGLSIEFDPDADVETVVSMM